MRFNKPEQNPKTESQQRFDHRDSEMSYGRLISGGGRLLRRLCTATTAAELPTKKANLYQRLAVLEKTGETVSQTLNQYITEGKALEKGELERYIQDFRKNGRFHRALEVSQYRFMLSFIILVIPTLQIEDMSPIQHILCHFSNYHQCRNVSVHCSCFIVYHHNPIHRQCKKDTITC